MIILTILIIPIQKHSISFHLFLSSSVSFTSVIVSEVQVFYRHRWFIPRYFILCEVMIKWVRFHNFSHRLLLVHRNATDLKIFNSIQISVNLVDFSFICYIYLTFSMPRKNIQRVDMSLHRA